MAKSEDLKIIRLLIATFDTAIVLTFFTVVTIRVNKSVTFIALGFSIFIVLIIGSVLIIRSLAHTLINNPPLLNNFLFLTLSFVFFYFVKIYKYQKYMNIT